MTTMNEVVKKAEVKKAAAKKTSVKKASPVEVTDPVRAEEPAPVPDPVVEIVRTEAIVGDVVAIYIDNVRHDPSSFIPNGLNAPETTSTMLLHAFRDGLLRKFIAPPNMPMIGKYSGRLYAARSAFDDLWNVPKIINVRIDVSGANLTLTDLIEVWRKRGVIIDHFHVYIGGGKDVIHVSVHESRIMNDGVDYSELIPWMTDFVVYADQAHSLPPHR